MNAFRTLPPLDRGTEYDPDEDEPPMELTWPHLEVCICKHIQFGYLYILNTLAGSQGVKKRQVPLLHMCIVKLVVVMYASSVSLEGKNARLCIVHMYF